MVLRVGGNRDRVAAVTVHIPNCQANLVQVRAVRGRDAVAHVNSLNDALLGAEYDLGDNERALRVKERFLNNIEEVIYLIE